MNVRREPITIEIADDHPVELISEDDRLWFEERPDRVLRLRYATDGDPIGPGFGHAVMVFCPIDGIRLRPGFVLARDAVDTLIEQDSDAALAPLFYEYLRQMRKMQIARSDRSAASPRKMAKKLRELLDKALERGGRLPSIAAGLET